MSYFEQDWDTVAETPKELTADEKIAKDVREAKERLAYFIEGLTVHHMRSFNRNALPDGFFFLTVTKEPVRKTINSYMKYERQLCVGVAEELDVSCLSVYSYAFDIGDVYSLLPLGVPGNWVLNSRTLNNKGIGLVDLSFERVYGTDYPTKFADVIDRVRSGRSWPGRSQDRVQYGW